jgi:hypothetical protein
MFHQLPEAWWKKGRSKTQGIKVSYRPDLLGKENN